MKNKLLKAIIMLSKCFLYGLVLQTLLLNMVLALDANGQYKNIDEVRVTLSEDQLSLSQFFREVQRQTPFKFTYEYRDVDRQLALTFTKKEGPVIDFLREAAQQSQLSFRQVNHGIDVVKKKNSGVEVIAAVDPITVTGTVVGENGEPIPGVTVSVPGSNIGTVTDLDGAYSITVPEGSTLVFSFIGFESQRIEVGDQSVINITLTEDMASLDEVVVVGYGTTSTKKLTTAVGSIDSDKMGELPITNIADAFAGNIPGVLAENGNGSPGAMPVIRVRGYGSINAGSEPLYVIDDVMATSTEFAALNPKTIERVDILKDAAAGAIYGSRAGNGVVIVTTKRGKLGKPQISLNITSGIQELDRKVDVLDRDEWIGLVKEGFSNDGRILPDFYNRPNSAFANTDWQDEIYRTAPFQNYQISSSGGTESVKYFVSANMIDQEGIMLTTYNNKYSTTGSLDANLSPKLKLGFSYSYTNSKDRTNNSIGGFGHGGGGYGNAGGIVQQSLWLPPIVPVYTENGDYGQFGQGEIAEVLGANGYVNPLANLLETYDVSRRNSLLGRIYLNYELFDGLTVNGSFGGTNSTVFREYHTSPYLAGNAARFANFSNPTYVRMVAGQSHSQSTSWLAETFMNYKKEFNRGHEISIDVGYSAQHRKSTATSANSSVNDRGANADNPIPAFDNFFRPNIYGAALVLGSGSFGENTFESVFGRLSYSYKDKYLLMSSIRRDGSSKFAPNKKYGIFPSISAGWRVSQESFMNELTWINELKLKASYGVSGNDQIGNYPWQGSVSYDDLYSYGSTDIGGAGVDRVLYPTSYENPDLKWETNTQVNYGIETSLFDNRVNLNADYFVRKTKDMLLNRAVPSENGIVTSVFSNIGNMTNKGIEIGLNTVNVQTSDFSWTTGINFTKIKNKVDEVFTSTGEIRYGTGLPGAGAIRIIEGRPMFQMYTHKVLGNYETEQDLSDYPAANQSYIGDVIVEDYNEDGIINDDDMQHMGNVLPDFTYGITSTVHYKNLDLNILINGSYGASNFIVAARQATLMRTYENTLQIFYDNRYRPGETGNHFAYASSGVTGIRHWNMSYLLRDASYLRIRNITLGYTIPKSLFSKLKMNVNSLRLYAGAQNLHTFTKYPLYNPEANTYGGNPGSAQFGVDNGNYPLAKTYTLGLNITF